MHCLHCGSIVEEGNNYCISCGHSLIDDSVGYEGFEVTATQNVEPSNYDESPSQIVDIWNTLKLQDARISTLEDRLLGRGTVMNPMGGMSQDGNPVIGIEGPAYAVSQKDQFASRRGLQQWEQILAGNWFAIIGGLALFIGFALFLKLAFDNDWIGGRTRIIIGALAGLLLLGLGEYLSPKRYGYWSQSVTASGFAILYVVIFAAFNIYGLIGEYPTLALFILNTIMFSLASVRYNAPILAALTVGGGVFTPFLLGAGVDSDKNIYILVAYIAFLDLGVIMLAVVKNWRSLILLGLTGSVALLVYWHESSGATSVVSFGILTGQFIMFLGATVFFHVVKKYSVSSSDLGLMISNAVVYVVAGCGILDDAGQEDWMGIFAFSVAGLYGIFSTVANWLRLVEIRTVLFLYGIGLILATAAFALQFEGPAIPIAWAAEAVILMYISSRIREPKLKLWSLCVLAISFIWLLIFEIETEWQNSLPLMNDRFYGFSTAIVACYLIAYFLKNMSTTNVLYRSEKYALPAILGVANFATLFVLSLELWGYADFLEQGGYMDNADNLQGFGLSILWCGYAFVLIVIGLFTGIRPIRIAGVSLLAVTVVKVFLLDSFGLTQGYRVASFMSLGVLLLIVGFVYHKYRRVIHGLLM